MEVTCRASAWADHRAYLAPGTEAFRRLLAALARLAAPPAELAVTGAVGVTAGRRRVRCLVMSRWTAVLSGLVAATVLLPRLPGPPLGGWPTVAAFAALWAADATVTVAVLHGCWRIWDLAQGDYETAVAAGAARSGVHVYSGFVLFLQMLVLALTWPVILELGWWGELAGHGLALTAFLHEGDPARQGVFLCLETVLVLYATTTPLTFLASHRTVRAWLERWRPLPDPFAAAALLLRLLPQEGLVVSGRRYRALPISWEVTVPRFGRRRQPSRCPVPARMLLCDDAVLLDLRDGRHVDGKVAHVHGKRLSFAGAAAGRPRLAGVRDWRAFRHDLPELLEKAASYDPSGGHAAEWAGRPPGG